MERGAFGGNERPISFAFAAPKRSSALTFVMTILISSEAVDLDSEQDLKIIRTVPLPPSRSNNSEIGQHSTTSLTSTKRWSSIGNEDITSRNTSNGTHNAGWWGCRCDEKAPPDAKTGRLPDWLGSGYFRYCLAVDKYGNQRPSTFKGSFGEADCCRWTQTGKRCSWNQMHCPYGQYVHRSDLFGKFNGYCLTETERRHALRILGSISGVIGLIVILCVGTALLKRFAAILRADSFEDADEHVYLGESFRLG
mmetsp:Transcript_29100/g.70981  ORF Transcript_29100/g.70981 Transcript_29100/m.70981 type:complete len:252 (-) Transcript_29100:171-926(-)